MATHDILFVQGAGEGAHPWDQPMVDNLRAALPDKSIAYPKIDGLETVDWPSTKSAITEALAGLKDGGIVVAHSLGGAAMLKFLSEGNTKPSLAGLFLIAVPYKAADGDLAGDDFGFPADFARSLPAIDPIVFYHSRDDDFVDFANLARYREKVTGARFLAVDGHQHQFLEPFPELAEDVRSVG